MKLINDVTVMHDAMKTLLNQALLEKKSPGVIECPGVGICFNMGYIIHHGDVDALYSDIYTDLRVLFKGWKHHSGDAGYPIPKTNIYEKWEGLNLEMRINLMRYALKKLADRKRRAAKRISA